MSLHSEMIVDMAEINSDLGNPTFTWQNNDYNCIASVSQFRRELESGGYSTDLLLTMTIPRYNVDGNEIFPNDIIPEPQQKITFNGTLFRLESVKQDSVFDSDGSGNKTSNGARLRMIGVSTNRGV